ncbi:DMT family transporter [Sinorhizobium fredii]|uniref:EamA family transporter n=2 Tax=Rhizobium fredii TaxID=380 RepID=A0A2A6M2B7_RHIFR|nr:DMT family transporter [Sinorhizobium fredii]ASY70052.1 Permease of the drug/metabolite transporter (DMT) superfamily [Sinorhizobium fredii CCBAU 83666]MCG5474777.1 DMT family transporter [Sinorhizobium fredii]MQW99007.1 EamA family transporter [Sinorhizobium fredii]MQX13133.1 EamA family transporter [Sinorhizobium fredii]PDT48924.1 EamA/RhaT family transporter [Sinorhizobium fredii]
MTALLAGGVAIAGSPIFVRLSEVGPMATAFWRVALALIPLVAWSWLGKDASADRRPERFSDYALLILPGVFLALDLGAWHLSLTMTSVANATLLANLAPVFVTLASWALFRSPVSRNFMAGLVVAIVGVIVLKGGPGALGDGDLLGDGIAVVAAMFYAGYILAIGKLRSRFSTNRIANWSTASAALCILPMALLAEPSLLPPTGFGWAMLFGLAFVCHAGGQVAITYALAYLAPAFSSLTLLIQPVLAAVLAWVLLSEPVGIMQAIGGAIVLIGILIARRG